MGQPGHVCQLSIAVFDSSGKGQGGAGSKTEKTLGDFAAEYAKSNRSTCKGCLERINKVRVRAQTSDSGFLQTSDVINFINHPFLPIVPEE